MTRKRPVVIDLFSGCGGLSVGLKRAGFTVLAAIESDSLAASTYSMNHPRVCLKRIDIRKLDPEELRKDLGIRRGELDLLAGCPPCQGFSTLRTFNGARKIEDPNNELLFAIVPFVQAFLPRAIMIENVPGLLRDERIELFDESISSEGYFTSKDEFDAVDFGVPQYRRRMIFIAARGVMPPFAKPIKRKRTVRAAIGRISLPEDSKDQAHCYPVNRSDKVMKIIKKIPVDGGSRNSLPDDMQLKCHKKMRGFHDIYGRLRWSDPSVTITSGCINPSKGRFLHPQQDRAITLREAALLQGFPKSYKFDLSRGRYPVAEMIGNAFPPNFASKHAEAIRQTLIQIK